MNIKLIKDNYHQLNIPKSLICILIPMLSVLTLIQPIIGSPSTANSNNLPLKPLEPSASPLILPGTNKNTPLDPSSTINSKDPPSSSSSQSVNHIFEYHCSPWIEDKIWRRIYPRLRLDCGLSSSASSSRTGCGGGGKGRGKDDPSSQLSDEEEQDSMDSSKVKRNQLTDTSSRNHKSDTIILDESKLSSSPSPSSSSATLTSNQSNNNYNSNNNKRSSMWPTHPLPRRMSENLSPSVCSYTGSATINDSLDWMQDYLHIMRSFNYAECLLFDNSSIDSICSSNPNQRIEKLKSFHFAHCDRYPLVNVLSDDAWAKVISPFKRDSLCVDVLKELNLLDAFAKQIYCQFEQLLSRYKCESYSIKGTCSACKKAYKEWVCSMVLPFYFDGIYIKPCRSFCEKVEQKCPHFHPATTYAGEPVFICIDPKIPYFENSSNIPYGSPGECYESCHLANETDLYSDKSDKSTCPSYESLLYSVLKKSLKEEMDDWKEIENNNNYSQASSSSSSSPSASSLTIQSNGTFNEDESIELIANNNKRKLKQKVNNNVHVRRSFSSLSESSSRSPSPSPQQLTSTPATSSSSYGIRLRDQPIETIDSVTTHPGANLDSIGSHKILINGIDGQHVQSMALPLDDDGSEDEGERDDDSISTTSSASSTLPTVSSPPTHYSVQSSLPNADINLTLSTIYHFSLLFLLLGLVR
ncbi:uncharacterized protein LOC128393494 [Panonychus citri]|uniref:uncharacterized protein LOC128393494 n=1 Tax=Panonychus citri TaxID=50023 RepID=UPI0023080F52|nr:uncharacterized protein LOC128393494 [Panonychus citri]